MPLRCIFLGEMYFGRKNLRERKKNRDGIFAAGLLGNEKDGRRDETRLDWTAQLENCYKEIPQMPNYTNKLFAMS